MRMVSCAFVCSDGWGWQGTTCKHIVQEQLPRFLHFSDKALAAKPPQADSLHRVRAALCQREEVRKSWVWGMCLACGCFFVWTDA